MDWLSSQLSAALRSRLRSRRAQGGRQEDDAAALPAGDVICTDTLVESVHFLGRETPQDLAHKLLAVNVSDVVAMNARPTHALLNLTLPSYCDPTWRAGFIEGLGQACELFSVQVLGGDTTRSPGPLVLSATLLGMLEERQMWRRAGAGSRSGRAGLAACRAPRGERIYPVTNWARE